jgi:hypothetical protein
LKFKKQKMFIFKKLTFQVTILLYCYFYVSCKNIEKRAFVGPLWPKYESSSKTIISFKFQNETMNEDRKSKVIDALNEIEKSLSINNKSCIEFSPLKPSRIKQSRFIQFVDGQYCSSGIGYQSNNDINLGEQCFDIGTIMHEVVHRFV